MGSVHARTIAEADEAELVAVVDPVRERAARLCEQVGGGVPLESVDGLLRTQEIDAAVVAVPDRLHVGVAVDLLDAGAHVLLEKPMADTLEGARAIAAAARRSRARLAVGHTLRHDPRHAVAAQQVAAGGIGEPVHFHARRVVRRGVGMLNDGRSPIATYQGVHDVDAVQWITGIEITRVYARTVASFLRGLGGASEDACVVLCELANGAVGTIELSWVLPDTTPTDLYAGLSVVGTNGIVTVRAEDHGVTVTSSDGFTLPDALHGPVLGGRLRGLIAEELREFMAAVANEREFVVPLRAALSAVAVVEAIERSVATAAAEPVTRAP
jgi:predicted dehydrogenase